MPDQNWSNTSYRNIDSKQLHYSYKKTPQPQKEPSRNQFTDPCLYRRMLTQHPKQYRRWMKTLCAENGTPCLSINSTALAIEIAQCTNARSYALVVVLARINYAALWYIDRIRKSRFNIRPRICCSLGSQIE